MTLADDLKSKDEPPKNNNIKNEDNQKNQNPWHKLLHIPLCGIIFVQRQQS